MNEDLSSFYHSQHAVVTGGTSGIGEAIASQLAKAGMLVTIMGRTTERLVATAESLKVTWQQVDVSRPESVQKGFAASVKAGGPITVLVNSAGAAESCAFTNMNTDLWERMLTVNLSGTYLCTRAVIDNMVQAGFGRIINIASTAAQKGYAYVSAYCAAKHGVLGLTRSLALEMARKGITVNAVCPGFSDTPMLARSLDTIVETTSMQRQQALAELLKHNPQGRLIKPQEVANTVLWLCHPDSEAVTGQAISVAGGEI